MITLSPVRLTHRSLYRALVISFAASLVLPVAARAANSTVPGSLSAYATILSAGFEWRITGDDDDDCAVTVEYRRLGDATWKPAQPLHRVSRLWPPAYGIGNLLAGSLFFLEPGTSYEARLTLNDPDGGTDQRVIGWTTRTEPQFTPSRTLYVTPGSGGGSGTMGDPFRGLASADAQAQPGDLYVLQPGVYHGTFQPTRNGTPSQPIVYRGADQPSVLLIGPPVATGWSSSVDLYGRRHVWIEAMSLTGCRRPLSADSTIGVVVRGCYVEPMPDSTRGISAAKAQDLFIADNFVQMSGDWEGIGRTGDYGTGGYGILVEGTGHVICRNKVIEAWDAIATPVSNSMVPAAITSNVDIYENFVDRASDDGIQTDAIHHNVRVFRNRLLNTGCGVSFQPCFGGPGYVLYNEIFNTRIYPFKLHQETYFGPTQETSGFVICHNTSFSNRHGWRVAGIWSAGRIRNNLVLGGRDSTVDMRNPPYPRTSLDYDGYNKVGSTIVRYYPNNHSTLASLYAATGFEQHGVQVAVSDFVSAVLPHHPFWDFGTDGYGAPYSTSDIDLRLVAGGAPIDRGQVLPNINDGYLGAAPDLGCYERGAALPSYGPAVAVQRFVGVTPAPALPSVGAPTPNPARGAMSIGFTLDRDALTTLRVYDVRGALVRTLLDGPTGTGPHRVGWNLEGRDGRVRPGVYFARLETGGRRLTRRLVVLDP